MEPIELTRLEAEKDGVLQLMPGRFNKLLVQKENGRIMLIFMGGNNREVQGGMDPADPDFPCHPYVRAMLLPMAFQNPPERVFILGLGAGVLQKALARWFPEVFIATAEIDENVAELARTCFCYVPSERQRLFLMDGRECLVERPERFDLIVMDAFIGSGSLPERLTDRDFFALCADRLLPGGVLSLNILHCDKRSAAIKKALADAFGHSLSLTLRDQTILFASAAPLPDRKELSRRAKALETERDLPFPLAKLLTRGAKRCRPITKSP
jgi:spermidine synthase